MASTYAPPSHRIGYSRAGVRGGAHSAFPLLVLVAAVVFVVSALALLLTQTGVWVTRPVSPSTTAAERIAAVNGAAAPVLSPAQVEHVLTYARAMQPDDSLVQVRPGVFAKRSNVEGVLVDGKTVYYDVLPHQSFGPLRAGQVTEQQVHILSREAQNGFVVLVYTKK